MKRNEMTIKSIFVSAFISYFSIRDFFYKSNSFDFKNDTNATSALKIFISLHSRLFLHYMLCDSSI